MCNYRTPEYKTCFMLCDYLMCGILFTARTAMWTLNFDQWKTFSKKYKPMRVRFWLVYKFSLMTFLRVHSNSKEVSYLSWQNTYPNLKTTCHIKLKIFLWTKLLENLLLAKYLKSVAAPLSIKVYVLYFLSNLYFSRNDSPSKTMKNVFYFI